MLGQESPPPPPSLSMLIGCLGFVKDGVGWEERWLA